MCVCVCVCACVCVRVHVCVCVCVADRVWRPGPEDGRDNDGQDSWKKVYLNFGFVFIQDMVERALVEEIVGEW